MPTPTPTNTPIPAPPSSATGRGTAPDPGRAVIIAEIERVFGAYAPGALNIARCESGYDPNAWNPIRILGSHASGVFQILYPSTWNGTSYRNRSPFDYVANIAAAHEIFVRDGYSWRQWECRP
jgi:hypothetical protein